MRRYLNMNMKYDFLKVGCIAIMYLGLFCSSCNSDSFEIGGYLVNPRMTFGMVDTVTIRVSTLVAADSVVTNGGYDTNGTGFSGFYNDPQLGAIGGQTFIEFSRTTVGETERYARFDSVTLVLRPNGNYYGDTTKFAAFKISRIKNPIEKNEDGRLYSTSKVPVEPHFVDTAFKVKVADIKNNEFEIKLPKSFGEWLFQGILINDDPFNSANFLKTFPGLSVEAGTGSACVHGLNIQDTACMIRIYYHISTTERMNKIMDFKANPYNSFYHLSYAKKDYLQMGSKDDAVPSSLTNNMGYVTAGHAPMYALLEFPHLNELLWLGQMVKIQQATLYVRPIRHSFDTVPLPPRLNIFYYDPTSGRQLSEAIRPPSAGGGANAGSQNGNLPENYQYIKSPALPQYTFDVTDFIANQLGQVGFRKWALCLVIPSDTREKTIQRLVFGDQNYRYKNNEIMSRDNHIKLEITYVAYND